MLDRLRLKLDSMTLKIGQHASRVSPSPSAWTLVGLLFALLAALAYSASGIFWAAVGGLAILASGFLDIVDGAVARHLNRISRRGSFLDSTLDRIGELLVYVGILLGGYSNPLVVLLALSLSLLVSYTRAKADSLGYSLAGVGIGERSERLIVLAVSSFIGLLFYGVILVAILAAVTLAERVYRVSAALS